MYGRCKAAESRSVESCRISVYFRAISGSVVTGERIYCHEALMHAAPLLRGVRIWRGACINGIESPAQNLMIDLIIFISEDIKDYG